MNPLADAAVATVRAVDNLSVTIGVVGMAHPDDLSKRLAADAEALFKAITRERQEMVHILESAAP